MQTEPGRTDHRRAEGPGTRRWRFGDFELDEAARTLLRRGRRVLIQPKPLAVLVELLRSHPAVVTKDALLDRVWGGSEVSEYSLTRAVLALRKALGQSGCSGGIVRTVRGSGYALAEAIEVEAGTARKDTERNDASSAGLVDRVELMTALEERLGEALDGRGGVALLVGEPGIGKSSICEEVVRRAPLLGFTALAGSGLENGESAPFRPWAQIVHHLARQAREGFAPPRLTPDEASVLRQAIPAASLVLPGESLPVGPRSSKHRAHWHQLRDAFVRFWSEVASQRPLLIVVDDLHRVDLPSARLFAALAREISRERILLLGAYREADLARCQARSAVVAAMVRQAEVAVFTVSALDRSATRELIERHGREPVAEPTLDDLHRRSGGNPFFLKQLLHLIQPLDRKRVPDVIPAAVMDAVLLQLEPVSPGCRKLLEVGAVQGSEFDADVAARAAGIDEAELPALLDEACAAHLVTSRDRAARRYRFSHVLLRDALYASLPSTISTELHGRIALALEERPSRDGSAAEIAYHFVRAGREFSREAGRASEQAATEAESRLAHDEVVARLDDALAALEAYAPGDRAHRCRLLVRRGEALGRAGRGDERRKTFLRAAELALPLGDPELLSRAALGAAGSWFPEVLGRDDELTVLLERALAHPAMQASPRRARLTARLAAERGAFRTAEAHSRALAEASAAEQIARREGDGCDLAEALVCRHFLGIGCHDPATQREISEEVVRLAAACGEEETSFWAHHMLASDCLRLGDLSESDVEAIRAEAIAGRLRQPRLLWLIGLRRAMRAQLEGDFERAEQLSAQTFEIGQRARTWNALEARAIQIFVLHWLEGRLAELEEGLRAAVAFHPDVVAYRSALALKYCETGNEGQARVELHRSFAHRLEDVPRDLGWPFALVQLTEVCTTLRESACAAELLGHVRALGDRCVVAGHANACVGALARSLGRLAAVLGHWELAEDAFDRALRVNRSLGARPFVALTQLDHAAMLRARGRRGDRARASALLAEVRDLAGLLGMRTVLERAARLAEDPAAGGRVRP